MLKTQDTLSPEEPPRAEPTSVGSSPIDRFLKRRARFRRIGLILFVLLLSSIVLGNLWSQTRGGDDWARYDRQRFVVQSVMAGDQIAIEPTGGGSVTIVKLLGIDGHSVVPDAATQPHWSMESYRALRDMAIGRQVIIALPGLSPRTPDGRLHAYAFVEGDPPALSLNERLVVEGQVYADRRREHPFHKQFDQAEQEARRKKRGLWADVRDDQQPPWRQDWLRKLRATNAEPAEPKAP